LRFKSVEPGPGEEGVWASDVVAQSHAQAGIELEVGAESVGEAAVDELGAVTLTAGQKAKHLYVAA
jgi:hypothetical protein